MLIHDIGVVGIELCVRSELLRNFLGDLDDDSIRQQAVLIITRSSTSCECVARDSGGFARERRDHAGRVDKTY